MSDPVDSVRLPTGNRALARHLLVGGPIGQEAREKEAMVDRDKMLDVTLQQIEKQFGKGAVMKLGEHPAGAGVSVIPTGSLALDLALGIGGVPRGRVMEVFGPEGSGKTTVCLHMIAEAQANGGIAAFIDAEHALDPTYARELGVNIDELLVSQPDSGEQALEIADMLVRSAALDLVVIDSVAALVPRAEIEGEMGDTHVGLQARLMSQAMRKLSGSLAKFDTTAIFINQLREKIGVMFGSPETTPGGRALKFYSSVRLDVRKIENLKDGTEVVGSRTRVKVVKNKVAPPFRQCEFDIMYGKGISKEGSLIDVGVDLEIIKKSGAWFTYEGEQLGQGRENARAFLAEHTDVRAEIERKIREAVGISAFGDEGEETPIQVVPDAVLDDGAPAASVGSGATEAASAANGRAKAKTGATER
jgi:recombination protein RecA